MLGLPKTGVPREECGAQRGKNDELAAQRPGEVDGSVLRRREKEKEGTVSGDLGVSQGKKQGETRK